MAKIMPFAELNSDWSFQSLTWEGSQEFEETTQLKSTRKRTEEKTEMAETRVESYKRQFSLRKTQQASRKKTKQVSMPKKVKHLCRKSKSL